MTNSFKISKNLISALIITHNEEVNVNRTLSALQWIPTILVIDSGSTDRTMEIVHQFDNTKFIYRKFDSFAGQCNFGISQLSSDWILSLDADYVVTAALSIEIKKLLTRDIVSSLCEGYSIQFRYCINGKPIQSGLLPPRTCLYKRNFAKYIDIGHGHRVVIEGEVGKLRNIILHDDRKPLNKWLSSQQKYQLIEAIMLTRHHSYGLPFQDLVRKHTFMAPFFAFFMCLVIRRGIFDGKEGVIYALQRLVAESLLYLYMHSENER